MTTKINILAESLTSKKIKLNQLAQYTSFSCLVELSGISHQGDEDVIDLIGKLLEPANITDYDPNQINIAHRTSS